MPRIPAGTRAALPILVTVPLFGISYGVLARAAEMGVVAPIVMSATTFAGSSQFAVASILEEGGGLAAAIVAALLLNARYAAISVSVAPLFHGSRLRRLLEAQLIVDESWALSAAPTARSTARCCSEQGSRSTWAGCSAPRSACSAAAFLATPSGSASTRPSRRSSSRCSWGSSARVAPSQPPWRVEASRSSCCRSRPRRADRRRRSRLSRRVAPVTVWIESRSSVSGRSLSRGSARRSSGPDGCPNALPTSRSCSRRRSSPRWS